MRRAIGCAASWVNKRQWRLGRDIGIVNVICLTLGALAIAVAGMRLLAVPISAASGVVARAYYPYSALGRAEVCVSNLQSLGRAMSLYVDDHDEGYPSVSSKTDKAVTWVALLRPYVRDGRAGDDPFECSCKGVPSDERKSVSSYGMNGALGGGLQADHDLRSKVHKSSAILLADRGDADRLALLSPWECSDRHLMAVGNLDFRHAGRANVLFADGHSASFTVGTVPNDWQAWGGPLAIRTALQGLMAGNSTLAKVFEALQGKNDAPALAALKSDRASVERGFTSFLSLWKANDGEGRDEQIEGLGWQLAQVFSQAGHRSFEEQLNAEQSRRSQDELTSARNGQWRQLIGPDGFNVDLPTRWTVTHKESGKYRQTFIQSASPYITVIVEKGTGSRPLTATSISWKGADAELRGIHGSRYSLLGMGVSTLNRSFASTWEFTLRRPGQPTVRKKMVGILHNWDSYSVLCAAPAADYARWEPVFSRITSSFQVRW